MLSLRQEDLFSNQILLYAIFECKGILKVWKVKQICVSFVYT